MSCINKCPVYNDNEEGNGSPLQYSCLGIPEDRGAWQATIYGVAESDTTWQLNNNNIRTNQDL